MNCGKIVHPLERPTAATRKKAGNQYKAYLRRKSAEKRLEKKSSDK